MAKKPVKQQPRMVKIVRGEHEGQIGEYIWGPGTACQMPAPGLRRVRLEDGLRLDVPKEYLEFLN